jgi:hypothetical protein
VDQAPFGPVDFLGADRDRRARHRPRAVISAATARGYAKFSVSDKLSWDPTAVSLEGMGIATLAIAVLGVLCISSEYSSGMIVGEVVSSVATVLRGT